MENFDSIKNIVQQVLYENELARNSDKHLILLVLQKMGFKIYISQQDLENIPSFETISRCRRKIVESNPELQASSEVVEYRGERKEMIKDIMKDKTVAVDNFIRTRTRGIEVESSPTRRGLFV